MASLPESMKSLRLFLTGLVAFSLLAPAQVSVAQTPPITLTAQAGIPRPDQDDATLHSIAIVGPKIWTVGDRGTIWRSPDSGQSWQFVELPQEARGYSFHSVCFLTDRVGWIAGGTVLPVGGVLQGIVLSTKDGGVTWHVQPGQGLPYLRKIQFFDLHSGVAIGERSTAFPSGALQTEDGGLTWTSIPASQSGHWSTAAFVSFGRGILGGHRNRQAVLNQGSLLPAGSGAPGLQGWRGASIDPRGLAWMVGDGATLVRSVNSGVSWEPLQEKLPTQLGDFTDFKAVAHHQQHVWVAGSPGSVIWHSADAGETWLPQRTGEGTPLTSIHFQNASNGIAVGHLGRICLTQDGGRTWHNARGGNRRLACLSIQSHADRTAIPFLTRWSREDGYRSAVMIATRRDTGNDAHLSQQLDVRLTHATQTAGANGGWIDWRLPVSLPMLEGDRQKLLEQWNRLTDRRLEDVLLTSLVGQIRTWRPSILLIDEPAVGDSSTDLLQRAITRAVDLAADSSFALHQTEICGLPSWQVRKVVLQRESGNAGTVRLDPYGLLPGCGTTLDLAIAPAMGQLAVRSSQRQVLSEFLVIPSLSETGLSDRNVFVDLGLSPGGDARRAMPTIRSLELEELHKQAQHRRTITAASARIISDPNRAGQLLAQLGDIVGPLSPEQAAQQLSVLGKMYHQKGEWNLAESVYSELISRYPDQPVAVDAMHWLLQYWSSAEMNWQRLRTMQATRTQFRSNAPAEGILQTSIEKALTAARERNAHNSFMLAAPNLAATIVEETHSLQPTIGDVQSVTSADGNAGNPHQMMLTRWQSAAMAIVKTMKQSYPQFYQQPEVQFSTAALFRRRGDHRQSDEIYSNFLKTLNDDPWSIAARGEAFLLRPGAQSPKPVIICKRVQTPPLLDGLLSDPCWAEATEIRLNDETGETFIGAGGQFNRPSGGISESRPVVLMARDDRFLYLAATVPVNPALPTDGPEMPGRSHDADFKNFDRLSFQFDVDRDYATFYQFEIDQRGQTRESCWEDQSYNPKWFVAASRTGDAWRIECAIPLEELLPSDRITGTTWGLGVTRLMPGVGSQSWTGSNGTVPQPALFGLVRFE